MNTISSKFFIFLFFSLGTLLVQIGYSSLISIQFLMFASLVGIVGEKPFIKNINLIAICSAAIVAGQLFYFQDEQWLDSLLRAFREILSVALLVSAKDIKWRAEYLYPKIKTAIKLLTLAILLLAALQYVTYSYNKSPLFFLPYNIYPTENVTSTDNCGVLPSCWISFAGNSDIDLHIRPVAFYSEPSYVGFIVLSILMTGHNIFFGKKYVYFITLLTTILLMSKTTSGLLVFSILLLFLNKDFFLKSKSNGAALIFCLIGLTLFTSFERISSITDMSAELSGYIRLVLPFIYIEEVFLSGNIFGVPPIYFQDFISKADIGALMNVYLDNAILNLFIFYGVMAIVIIFCFIKNYKSIFLLYIFLCGMFNGSIFSYDKAFIISISIILFNSLEDISLFNYQKRIRR